MKPSAAERKREPIDRAFDHHLATGAVVSVQASTRSGKLWSVYCLGTDNALEVNLAEATALCYGLAAGERAAMARLS